MNTKSIVGRSFARHTLGWALLCAGFAAHAACTTSTPIFLSQGSGGPTSLLSSAATLPVSFGSLGAAVRTYNAIGYNDVDDKLYGISNSGQILLEIDQTTGASTDVGAVSGLPAGSYNSGAFSNTGAYYVKPFSNNSQLYRIDVTASPPTATLITLSQAFTTSDMAWVGSLMYSTADNGQLYSIDVATGTTTAIGSPDNTGGVLGAQFSGTNGLFGSANNGSGLYRINLTTGQRDKISDSPASGANDGASCPTVALFEPLPPEPPEPPEPPPPPTPVPTLDFAGLGLLSLLGAGAGALGLRRRKRSK